MAVLVIEFALASFSPSSSPLPPPPGALHSARFSLASTLRPPDINLFPQLVLDPFHFFFSSAPNFSPSLLILPPRICYVTGLIGSNRSTTFASFSLLSLFSLSVRFLPLLFHSIVDSIDDLSSPRILWRGTIVI